MSINWKNVAVVGFSAMGAGAVTEMLANALGYGSATAASAGEIAALIAGVALACCGVFVLEIKGK